MTKDEHDALMNCQTFIGELYKGLLQSVDPSNKNLPAANWCIAIDYDSKQKGQMPAAAVDQIAKAVVAALPPGTTNLTIDDVVQACKQAMSEQTWTVIPAVS